MTRYRSGYSHGKSVARMYRKLERFGASALSRRELRLLKRESDEGMRNPGRGRSERDGFQRHAQTKAPSQRDWEGFTRIKRMMRVNPKRSGRGRARRNPLGCRMSKESMFHELKHHGSHWRPQKQRVAIVLSTMRKCHRRNPRYEAPWSLRGHRLRKHWAQQQDRVRETQRWQKRVRIYIPDKEERKHRNPKRPAPRDRSRNRHNKRVMRYNKMIHSTGWQGASAVHRAELARSGKWRRWNPALINPKRDGTPTRGELRKGKYSSYLKTISQRGKDAEAVLARIHGVPAASAAAVKEHVPSSAVAVMDAPVAKVEAAVEHAEAKHLRSRIDELTILHKDLLAQIDEMGDDDLAAYEVSQLQDQAAKIAKQRGLLRAKAQSLGIMTNPGPRRNPARRGHRHQVLVGLHAYGQALQRLKQAIHAHRR